MFIKTIKEIITNVGGAEVPAYRLQISYRRCLKEGTKITNLSANKGVIRLKKLGYAIDPKTGVKRKLDVIVSSKAVLKRKNYTQVVEAILNTLNNENSIVVDDYADTSEDTMSKALSDSGFSKDGTWLCDTYAGKLKCICGKVFWGVNESNHLVDIINQTDLVENSDTEEFKKLLNEVL